MGRSGNQICVISFLDLRAEFEEWSEVNDHFADGSALMTLIKGSYFCPTPPDANNFDISVDRALILGILMCRGDID
jgi:hypothetical protein